MTDIKKTAELLSRHNQLLILCHMKPDGDTLGSAFALKQALDLLGKTTRIECSDGFPAMYSFVYGSALDQNQPEFTPAFIVAVDIADVQLLGSQTARYADHIDLCIDHHPSNTNYAKHLLLQSNCAATAQVIYQLLIEMKIPISPSIATSLYTGICTDTGCFRYSNTSAAVLRTAADLVDAGAENELVNRLLFDTKSRSRLLIERMALETLEYCLDDRCAMLMLTDQMLRTSGAKEEELEGISAIPRTIEGVEVGVTLREKPHQKWRISLRTNGRINASEVCGRLGGGGHVRAAGCIVKGTAEQAKQTIRTELMKEFA